MNIVLFSSDEMDESGEVRLATDDSRAKHIRDVLRLGRGASLRAGVVDGLPGKAEIRGDTAPDARFPLVLRFIPDETLKTATLPYVDLIIGSVRPIQLKRLLRDLASMGVSRVVVATAELSEASYVHSNIWYSGRIRQLCIEGSSQGGHTRLPEVSRCESIGDAVAALHSIHESEAHGSVARVRLERGAPAASETTLFAGARRVLLAIGPERGFTERETRLLDDAGFEQLGIPGGTLRTETAATAAVCVVRSWAIDR